MHLYQLPKVKVSPAGFVEFEVKSERDPTQNQAFQMTYMSTIEDVLRYAYATHKDGSYKFKGNTLVISRDKKVKNDLVMTWKQLPKRVK